MPCSEFCSAALQLKLKRALGLWPVLATLHSGSHASRVGVWTSIPSLALTPLPYQLPRFSTVSLRGVGTLPAPLHLLKKYSCIYFWLCWVFGAARAFSSCSRWALLSSWGGWASHSGGFSWLQSMALGHVGFSSCGAQAQSLGSWALEHWLNSCGAQD